MSTRPNFLATITNLKIDLTNIWPGWVYDGKKRKVTITKGENCTVINEEIVEDTFKNYY
jgi:hypothetical protein